MTLQRREYKVDERTALIFVDVIKDGKSNGPSLSIISDKGAETKWLGPKFGPALERIIKRMAGRRK